MDRRLKKSTFLLGFGLPVIVQLLTLSSALAEYRVYQYFVVPVGRQYYQSNKASTIKSTLAPISYISYHGGRSSVRVTLLRTWICPGHTGHFQDFCPSPYEKLKETLNQTIEESQKNNLPPKE